MGFAFSAAKVSVGKILHTDTHKLVDSRTWVSYTYVCQGIMGNCKHFQVGWCYCGSKPPSDSLRRAETLCTLACAGDGNKICGGSAYFNVRSLTLEEGEGFVRADVPCNRFKITLYYVHFLCRAPCTVLHASVLFSVPFWPVSPGDKATWTLASSSEDPSGLLSYLNDGDELTTHYGQSELYPWIQIDLGSSQVVKGASFRGDCSKKNDLEL